MQKSDFFNDVLRHLIAGNVLRGQAYPLCVGAERGLQAERLASAREASAAQRQLHTAVQQPAMTRFASKSRCER